MRVFWVWNRIIDGYKHPLAHLTKVLSCSTFSTLQRTTKIHCIDKCCAKFAYYGVGIFPWIHKVVDILNNLHLDIVALVAYDLTQVSWCCAEDYGIH